MIVCLLFSKDRVSTSLLLMIRLVIIPIYRKISPMMILKVFGHIFSSLIQIELTQHLHSYNFNHRKLKNLNLMLYMFYLVHFFLLLVGKIMVTTLDSMVSSLELHLKLEMDHLLHQLQKFKPMLWIVTHNHNQIVV